MLRLLVYTFTDSFFRLLHGSGRGGFISFFPRVIICSFRFSRGSVFGGLVIGYFRFRLVGAQVGLAPFVYFRLSLFVGASQYLGEFAKPIGGFPIVR